MKTSSQNKRKWQRIGIMGFLCLLLMVCFFTAFAENLIENSQQSSPPSENNKDKAFSYKKLGDHHVSKGDYENAAIHYLKALEIGRNHFSKEERIEMAKYIAWGEKPQSAAEELRLILAQNPENSKARTLYARTLSWAGKLDEAVKEADMILSRSPEEREALLIKADALRWKGNYKKAICLYKRLLEKEETFDARLGWTYALLFSAKLKEAKESRKLLQPKFPYQEQEIERLDRALKERTQSKLEAKSSYYRDTENNQVLRSWLWYEYWAGKLKLNIYFRHTEAQDNTRRARAKDFSFNMYSKLTDSLAVGGSLGFTQFGKGRPKNYLTGQLKADFSLRNGSLGAYVQRDSFTYTAQLIDCNIMVTKSGLNISQSLSRRVYLYTSYNYGDYSDKNNSHDFLFSLSYAFLTKTPSLMSGYQFRYLDFRHHSGSGYFDPDKYVSLLIFMAFLVEKESLFLYLRPFFGYQSFKRYGEKTSDFFGGGYGTFRSRLNKNLMFEFHAEGGNYAAALAPGWKYYLISVGLILRF
jgi:tetratricopeptide (TPR) repeat protein